MQGAAQIEAFLMGLPGVSSADQWGYRFFFYATDMTRPFATLIDGDQEHDRYSQLDREGGYRLNMGVRRETFRALFPEPGVEVDYTRLNVFLPHPEYAAFHYLCVLAPEGKVWEQSLKYLEEAYALAKERFEKKTEGGEVS